MESNPGITDNNIEGDEALAPFDIEDFSEAINMEGSVRKLSEMRRSANKQSQALRCEVVMAVREHSLVGGVEPSLVAEIDIKLNILEQVINVVNARIEELS